MNTTPAAIIKRVLSNAVIFHFIFGTLTGVWNDFDIRGRNICNAFLCSAIFGRVELHTMADIRNILWQRNLSKDISFCFKAETILVNNLISLLSVCLLIHDMNYTRRLSTESRISIHAANYNIDNNSMQKNPQMLQSVSE